MRLVALRMVRTRDEAPLVEEMMRKDKIVIPLADLESLSIRELMIKYQCSDSVISRLRRESDAKPKKRSSEPVPIPPELIAKWVSLYQDGLTIRRIKERYSQYGTARISEIIRRELGLKELRHSSDCADGWCAT